MNRKTAVQERSYWVVSPNVRNNEATVSEWRQASVLGRAAFMGWGPNDRGHKQIGYKFAHVIMAGDIILIARRHNHKPEIVGFGVVDGKYKRQLQGIKTPQRFGSLRKLLPFVDQSRPPAGIPFVAALHHSTALATLHPDTDKSHERVCKWLDAQLSKKTKNGSHTTDARQTDRKRTEAQDPRIAEPPQNYQLDYKVRTKSQIKKAKKIEAELLQQYRIWLQQRHRKLKTAKYKKFQCDGYEEACRNLIEAKSSTRREHIRMAVGQLLDYGFQGRKKFGHPHMAILVPEEPNTDVKKWLDELKISLIWRKKGIFVDNANGQFT